MATVIDSLLITLGLDPSGVEKGVKAADNAVSSGLKNIENKVAKTVGTGVKMLGAYFGLGAIKNTFQRLSNELGPLEDLSQLLNVSVKDLDAWGQAVQRSGGTTQGFQGSLTTLNTKIQDATVFGLKKAQMVFDELDMSLKNTDGSTKTAIQVFEELAAKADTMDKSKFAGVAKKLGFDQGSILLLQQGSKATKELVDHFKELAYDDKQAAFINKTQDEIDEMSRSMDLAAANVFVALKPALEWVLKKLTEFSDWGRKNPELLTTGIIAIATVITATLIPAIASAVVAAAPIIAIAAVIAGIGLLIEDFYTYMQGGESALEGLWKKLGTPEEVKKSWEDFKSTAVDVWTKIKEGAKKFASYFAPAVGSLKTIVTGALTVLEGLFSGSWGRIWEGFTKVWGGTASFLNNIFGGALNAILDLFTTIFSKIAEVITGKISGALSMIPGFDEAAKRMGDSAGDYYQSAKDGGMSASAAVSPAAAAAAAGPVDNSTTTTVTGTTINVTTSDPVAAGNQAAAEVRKLASTGNGANKSGS